MIYINLRVNCYVFLQKTKNNCIIPNIHIDIYNKFGIYRVVLDLKFQKIYVFLKLWNNE